MNFPPILSIIIFMPLICAVMVAAIRGEKGDEDVIKRNIKHLSFFSSAFVLAFALFIYFHFDTSSDASFQFVEKYVWFEKAEISYHLGIDGISLHFILLTAFLTPICILASWNAIKERLKEYMIAFLVLESFMIGAFATLDSVLFYVFFEGVLIPMFLIIGIWGGEGKIYASYKLFLYTLFGSILMLLALLGLYTLNGTTDITDWIAHPVASDVQKWLWLAFFASFAVRLPMWPVHTWLPDAHVGAPTAGSIILAGVLLKMGGYGFLRFSLPMLPDASLYFAPFVMTLSVIAIIYASLVALVQEDMKKLIAYSSIAHMGFVTLGLFSFNAYGIEGAVFQMISHGLISAGLFLCIGMLYNRLHTREIKRFGGIINNMPNFAVVFMIFTLGAISLPGTSGFVGEFLSILGAYKISTCMGIFAASGMVLGATYMLILYRRVFLGPQDNIDTRVLEDINIREKLILLPVIALILYLGIYPNVILDKISAPAINIAKLYSEPIAEAELTPYPRINNIGGEEK